MEARVVENEHESESCMEEDEKDDDDSSSSEGPPFGGRSGWYYTKYHDYISPSGTRYKKHDAAVPHEHLIEYVKCMNYQKFEGRNVVIELDKERKCAKITRYREKYVKASKHYLDDEAAFYDEIYALLRSGQPVTCYRPSYMYTSDFLCGNDCGYRSEDLEDEKYSGHGVEEISYDGHTFRP